MDFAFVGPVFSDHAIDYKAARKMQQKRTRYKKVHSKSFASDSSRTHSLGRITINTLKHIAAKYDNLYKTSYYINLIPHNDKWCHAPFKVPKTISATMQNHNKILDSFKCPDHKHKYSSHIQQCLDLFDSLRKTPWQLKQEKQDLKIYSPLHTNSMKSEIVLPFSTAIVTGIILNDELHRNKWDTNFRTQQFIKRYSMFTHVSHQQNTQFDQVLINFIYPLSDGSIIIGSKTIKHEQYPESASSSRCESDINLFHIIPNFDKYSQETDYEKSDYLHSSILIYYNNIKEIKTSNPNIDINYKQYLIADSLCILQLKHYIKSIWHTLHRRQVLYIPPFPMLQMLGINGIYMGRDRRGNRRSHSNSLNTYNYNDDSLLFRRFNNRINRSNKRHSITATIKLEYNALIFTRQDWIGAAGHRLKLKLNDVQTSVSMDLKDNDDYDCYTYDCKDDATDISDDEYGIKRKKNKMLSFKNAASCITLSAMAMSQLLQETHSCNEKDWIELAMKTPSGLTVFEHVNNEHAPHYYYYHHKGSALLSCSAKYIFDLLCDPLFRFSYDIMVDTVQLIEKLDDNTYIVRLVHTNKQCFLKTQRETIVVITHRIIIPNHKYVLAAISIQHPAFPTEDSIKYNNNNNNNQSVISKGASKSIHCGAVRTDIKSSGWIIETDNTKNKISTRVTYIMNVDFGGNVPSSIKRTVAKKQPFAIFHLAKALKMSL